MWFWRTVVSIASLVKEGLRKHRLVALVLAAALVLGGVVAFSRIAPPQNDGAGCTELHRTSDLEASALAVECGAEVEVTAERTPWMRVFARPDGTRLMTVDAVPSQTDVNGVWEPLDVTVMDEPQPAEPSASGAGSAPSGHASTARLRSSVSSLPPEVGDMLPVAAPVFPMWFNPGGEAGAALPLGVVERDGSWVELWFPLDLPVPVVDERFVTYDFGNGIRLVVAVGADGSGFRPVVELDSPEAAAQFQAALAKARAVNGLEGVGYEIPYRVESSPDLSLRGVDGVGFELVGADEQVLFWSPPSSMWDSAGDAAGGDEAGDERLEFPLPGDRSATMPVRVEGADGGDGTVVVSPDEDLLTSPETVWPVRIDPTLGGRTPAEWVAIRTGGFTSPIYKWTDTSSRNGESMGHCSLNWSSTCNTTFTSRLVWEFGGDVGTWMKTLDASDIVSASFSADPGGRGSCESTRTDAYHTSSITSEQRYWSTLKFVTNLSNVTAPQGDACSDAGTRRGWDIDAAVRQVADVDGASVVIGLKANNESTSAGYKTYRADARLNIIYNRPPNKPTSVRLSSPAKSCASGDLRPVIADDTPTISAVASDPDGADVRVRFQVLSADGSTLEWQGDTAAQDSGSSFAITVPKGQVLSGKIYRYRANAYDGVNWSGWSTALCAFSTDFTKPAEPEIEPVRTGVKAIYDENVERGGVGVLGKFKLTNGNSSAITSFKYSFNSTSLGQTAAPDSAGSAVISYTPTAAGPVTLRVKAYDAAGNGSEQAEYVFDVAQAKEDAIWMLDEGTGTKAADSSGKTPAQDLLVRGATWSDGPHELFQSRQGDGALSFDGVNDEASTGPVVDTTDSFVVSAFVQLDTAQLGKGPFTVMSQDGVTQSGFELSYLPSCTGMTGGCWSFGMKSSDTTGATATVVGSTLPVRGDRWVHLVGAHDKIAKTIRLWACDIGTPEDPASGDPVKTSKARGATPWSALGVFTVGRGLKDGATANRWPGLVDNVRIFSGQIVAESKIRRMCQGAESRNFETGLDALDPTTSNGE